MRLQTGPRGGGSVDRGEERLQSARAVSPDILHEPQEWRNFGRTRFWLRGLPVPQRVHSRVTGKAGDESVC